MASPACRDQLPHPPPAGMLFVLERVSTSWRSPHGLRIQPRAAGLPGGAPGILRRNDERGAGEGARDGWRGRRSRVPEGDAADGPGRPAGRRLADRARGPGPHADRAVHLRRRDPDRRLPPPLPHPEHRRADASPVRERGAEARVPAQDPRRRALLRDRLLGARGRHRPRIAPDDGRSRRRRVGDQRPEDVDQPRGLRGLHLARRADRPRRSRSIADSRCSWCPPTAEGYSRQTIRTVGGVTHQRHLLRRRPGARRRPDRRREQRLGA